MKKLLLASLFVAGTLQAQQIPPSMPTKGLIGWYPFNTDFSDSSGNGNHLKKVGNPVLATDRFGKKGAYRFGGSDEFRCDMKHTFRTQDTLTFSCWVKVETAAPTTQNIVSIGDDAINDMSLWGYRLALDKHPMVDNQDFWYYQAAGDASYAGNGVNSISSSTKNRGGWDHFICMWTSKHMYLYLNGKLVRTITEPKKIMFKNNRLIIGACGNVAFSSGNKVIDDVAIWSRALTPDEIDKINKNLPQEKEELATTRKTESNFFKTKEEEVIYLETNKFEVKENTISTDRIFRDTFKKCVKVVSGKKYNNTYQDSFDFTSDTLLLSDTAEIKRTRGIVSRTEVIIDTTISEKIRTITTTINTYIKEIDTIWIEKLAITRVNNTLMVSQKTTDTLEVRCKAYIDVQVVDVNNLEKAEVVFYPNPATDFIKIKSEIAIIEVQVFDMVGKKVIEERDLGEDNKIDLSLLPRGYYIIGVVDEQGNPFSSKIFKQ